MFSIDYPRREARSTVSRTHLSLLIRYGLHLDCDGNEKS